MARKRKEPLLLTPGPLTTSAAVKRRMQRDWGSRDSEFVDLTAEVRRRLVEVAGGRGTHVTVPVQGSGTYALEGMIGTLVPRRGKLLVLVNGAYGRRIARIAEIAGRASATLATAEEETPDAASLDAALRRDEGITHVGVVHCETTTGILNPLERIAEVTARCGRRLLVDAVSSFGALPLDVRALPAEAVAASANKCLEGVPGVAFVIARADALAASAGNAPTLSLDLHDQWRGFERNGEWRFTPPTHVIAALAEALREHEREGGVAGRGARYRRNREVLVRGMRSLGFRTLLADEVQAPIIVTFLAPADPRFAFADFYARLKAKGVVIYPGKLTERETFRIGCIGHVGEAEMREAVAAVGAVLEEMGVKERAPAEAAAAVRA